MKFNPEDGNNFGPHCRNCHKGSSACGTCHLYNSLAATSSSTPTNWLVDENVQVGSVTETKDGTTWTAVKGGGYNTGTTDTELAANNGTTKTTYDVVHTSDNQANGVATWAASSYGFIKRSREANWADNWRMATGKVDMGKKFADGADLTASVAGTACSDDGVSWPHRTLGWKMLKDDLFGIEFDSTNDANGTGILVNAGTARNASLGGSLAHDIDSVCLDCHNPTVWKASTAALSEGPADSHEDDAGDNNDNYNDELLLRGLP